jgi:hypothetical protein
MAGLKETVLNFGPGNRLVGVVTRPTDREAGRPSDLAVVFANAGIMHRVGPNRIHVRLARRLAAAGVTSLRLDLPGIGDSGAIGEGPSIRKENEDAIRSALSVLETRGIARRFVMFGLCSGADNSFNVACNDERVVGFCVIDPSRLFRTWKSRALGLLQRLTRSEAWLLLLQGKHPRLRWLRQRIWPSRPQDPGPGAPAVDSREVAVPVASEEDRQAVASALSGLIARRVEMCFIITGSQREIYTYRTQFLDAFPRIGLEKLIRLELLRSAEHTFPVEASRVWLERTVLDWMTTVRFPEATTVPTRTSAS